MDEEELLTRLAEEEEMGLNYKKKCEQGNADIVQLDHEVEKLQVDYFILFPGLANKETSLQLGYLRGV